MSRSSEGAQQAPTYSTRGLLLDTSAVIYLLDDHRLRFGSTARATIASASLVNFSSVSIWEMHIKALKGHLTVPGNCIDLLHAAGARELSFTAEHGASIHLPHLDHGDPFDRLIATQAILEGLTLVTSDAHLLAADNVPTLDARR